MEKNQNFQAISKICLNNWHYINRKILSFHQGINFFTGHSGSGKSTVIDALQIVLYASTDGRGFFNKAAADDSDRNLIEYLRGMVNINEKNEAQYLRNHNFSSTIVIELEQSGTKEKQCIGVVFDVDTSTNDIGRMFFWHAGELLSNAYRNSERCLTTMEVREYLQRTIPSERYYCGVSNDRFRKNLYDVYLGGLDREKFPRLFKKAIPFRMNMKLEDFVKEYICMQQDIQIEDLQESVMQYGRMRNKIEETLEEIHRLEEIRERYRAYDSVRLRVKSCEYHIAKLEMLHLKAKIQEYTDRIEGYREEIEQQERNRKIGLEQANALKLEYERILLQINDSGYSKLEMECESLEETMKHLAKSKLRWEDTVKRLREWKGNDQVSNQMLWDMEQFLKGEITQEELKRLQQHLAELKEELLAEQREAESEIRRIQKEEKESREEWKELKQGRKAYPKELEEAAYELQNRLTERCKKFVPVHILADLLDIRDEKWHNAVEGYLASQKLLLVVEPSYAKDALELYQELERKKYHRVAVLDTKRVLESVEAGEHPIREGSLAEEVTAKESYVRAFLAFALGNVMKCESVEELREHKIGITADCILYKGFRLQHLNPEHYTRRAYIGEISLRHRIRQLEQKCDALQQERMPLQERIEELKRMGKMEMLSLESSDYLEWQDDCKEMVQKEKRYAQLQEEMRKLREDSISALENQKLEIVRQQEEKNRHMQQIQERIWKSKEAIEKCQSDCLQRNAELTEREHRFEKIAEQEKTFQAYLEQKKSTNYEYLRRQRLEEKYPLQQEMEKAYRVLVECRSAYLRQYMHRTCSTTIENNEPYDRLLENLSCDRLESYRESAKKQAYLAVEHFKDDFVFKIRSAIQEAYLRKDELNRIIRNLNFGKDKYQFVISKNQGADGKYYKMFMDDSLQVNPTQLTNAMENQMNMFTMEHEDQYGDMMNELISIFIPPENATREELEEAKKNMDKYADYRTYLSFDMQQIIDGNSEMTIGLSKMIKKNSGGEGQNPLYVALLASFAQIYRVNEAVHSRRNPTIRLVVLDEAFSKMDGEKVASCISLIRGLGFQAIICATNDKIQNYLENVDKTFLYANENKKQISILEFEKQELNELL